MSSEVFWKSPPWRHLNAVPAERPVQCCGDDLLRSSKCVIWVTDNSLVEKTNRHGLRGCIAPVFCLAEWQATHARWRLPWMPARPPWIAGHPGWTRPNKPARDNDKCGRDSTRESISDDAVRPPHQLHASAASNSEPHNSSLLCAPYPVRPTF